MVLCNARFALVVGLSIFSVVSCASTPAVQCPPDAKLANLLAGSAMVVVGKLDVPKQRLIDESRTPSPQYVDLPIQIEGILKGGGAKIDRVHYYPKNTAYQPTISSVIDSAGARSILFLTQVGDDLYFSGGTPNALKPATDSTLTATRAEVSRQEQIIGLSNAGLRLAHYAEVRSLIARLGRVSDGEQQRVFDRLEALGNEAVPAIIAEMDDRRPLRTRAISLVNHSPDAFEGVRHYGPEQVVDGLHAVLNQITGEYFGSIENGGSRKQRDASVAGWRVYAADLRCMRVKRR